MHLVAIIKQDQRCSWRPWQSKLADALRLWVQVNWEIKLKAGIKRVPRYTRKPSFCQLNHSFGGSVWDKLGVVNLRVVDWQEDMIDAEICSLVNMLLWECGKSWLCLWAEGKLAGGDLKEGTPPAEFTLGGLLMIVTLKGDLLQATVTRVTTPYLQYFVKYLVYFKVRMAVDPSSYLSSMQLSYPWEDTADIYTVLDSKV